MIDEKKIAQYNAEMTEHTDGAIKVFNAIANGKSVSREQDREMADYVLTEIKKNIESCPFASQEEKDAEIHCRENLVNVLKSQIGL